MYAWNVYPDPNVEARLPLYAKVFACVVTTLDLFCRKKLLANGRRQVFIRNVVSRCVRVRVKHNGVWQPWMKQSELFHCVQHGLTRPRPVNADARFDT